MYLVVIPFTSIINLVYVFMFYWA